MFVGGTDKPRLVDRVRHAIRLRHYSYRTEQQYVAWIKRFIRFHGLRHPAGMGKAEITSFLSHLASNREVSASTQAQALAALLFLYRHVLEQELPWLDGFVRARRPKRVPVVLTRSEVRLTLAQLSGTTHLLASLLYGAGLRLSEGLNLRVKDLDLEKPTLIVRNGKGARDRVSVVPASLRSSLAAQLADVARLHELARSQGFAGAELPAALARKYPGAHLDWAGSTYFLRRSRVAIHDRARGVGITSIQIRSSAPSSRPCGGRAFTSRRLHTRCGTALRPTFSNPAPTSGPFRSCSATRA